MKQHFSELRARVVAAVLRVAHLGAGIHADGRLGIMKFGSGTPSANSRGVPARAKRVALPAAPKTPVTPPQVPRLPVLPQPIAPADDDPDHEMRGASPVAMARRRERARCAGIVTSAVGLKQPGLAYALAFNTSLSVAEAIGVLNGMLAGTFSHLALAVTTPREYHRGARVH
jgi:hypothetical protein